MRPRYWSWMTTFSKVTYSGLVWGKFGWFSSPM